MQLKNKKKYKYDKIMLKTEKIKEKKILKG